MLEKKELARILGAERVIPVSTKVKGPIDLLMLRLEVERRLISSGGRPTDSSWDVKRQIPFRQSQWQQLVKLATALSTPERVVSPAQLASIILDDVLERINTQI